MFRLLYTSRALGKAIGRRGRKYVQSHGLQDDADICVARRAFNIAITTLTTHSRFRPFSVQLGHARCGSFFHLTTTYI